MNIHKNARLTPIGRERLVRQMLSGLAPEAAARAVGVSPRTAYKWLARFKNEGVCGLADRSSRPHKLNNPTPADVTERIVALRRQRFTGKHIARLTGVSSATVSRILRKQGLSRIKDLEPKEPERRYEHAAPGDMIHLDIKKLGRFERPGHRVTGDRTGQSTPRSNGKQGYGWEYVHVCIDDHSRLAFTQVFSNEKAVSAVAHLKAAVAWYEKLGVHIKRVMTDNGSCYKSKAFAQACRDLDIKHIRTKPYTPRTNGKAERFIQTAIREWAYSRPYQTSDQRAQYLSKWTHMYNWHRPHGGIKDRTPVSRLRLNKNNLLIAHTTEFTYDRTNQPRPKIGPWQSDLDEILVENCRQPKRERLTVIRIYEELRGRGYDGGYDAVRRYATQWSKTQREASADAYVPLSFDPGEAYQFDWSHEVVILDGATVTIKVAHVRLSHSRMPYVRAYPRETQEMVFDAHDKAFAFFGGACARGIYDNMKTAVDTILVGKDRKYNRRFQQMCGHYLVDPVACSPASGWEKGQVENQVGVIRRRFFVPRPKFKSFAELNAWLEDRCMAWAKAHSHPEMRDKTIWEVFEDERPSLVPYTGPFDGFHAVPVSVSKTCLVRFDNNKYSVDARAVGRPVEIRSYADRIECWQKGKIVGSHSRAFGRGQTIYDPLHYIPVLARKPGALRNGAPFKEWELPTALQRVQRKLNGQPRGDRQPLGDCQQSPAGQWMVDILGAILTDGLEAVEAACAEALVNGVHSSGVILNTLACHREPEPILTITTPDAPNVEGS